MADEMNGEIFDISLATNVDMSQVDELARKIDKLQSEEHKIDLYANISPDDEQAIKDTLGDIVEYAESLDVKLKVDIDGDFNTLIYNLKQLEKIVRRLPVIKTDGGVSTPQVASRSDTKKATSVTSAQKAIKSVDEEVKNYADTITYTKAVLSELNDAFREAKTKINDYSRNINAYDKNMIDTNVLKNIERQTTKSSVESKIRASATRVNSASSELANIYKQSLKLKDGTSEQILELLKQSSIIPDGTELTIQTFKDIVSDEWQKYVSEFRDLFHQGLEKGRYQKDDGLSGSYVGRKNSEQIDELRDTRLNDIELLTNKQSTVPTDKLGVEQANKNVAKYVEQLANALNNNTEVIKKETVEETDNSAVKSGGLSVEDLHEQLQNFLTALNRGRIKDIKNDVNAIKEAIIKSQNAAVEQDNPDTHNKNNSSSPPDLPDSKSGWTEGTINLVGGSLLDIKDIVKQGSASADLIFEESDEINLGIKDIGSKLDDIYNNISNGIQVNNGNSGNNPTPPPTPLNTPPNNGTPNNPKPSTPLPTRTREDIDELARLKLDDLNSQIQDLQFLLKQTGGIADSVFSQSDLDDVLTKLSDAKGKLDNIVDVASKKNVSPKALATIDNELTNIQNTLSDLNTLNPNAYNILSLAENYHNAFDIGSDELNANEILEPLKEMRDLLASAHIDTSSYDNAISEIEGRVERLKNTVESWTSIDLDASQFSSAYDAVEKISDELSDSLDGFKPLAQNAEDQIKQIFEFDDEIKELDKLEGKITSFYGLIQKTKRSGIDLNTIDIGNGKTLADAESLFQDYFNKKNSLNQYTQGQFSSEAEFSQYRAEIETNLIQPIQAYINNMNDAKIAIESVKTAEKDLADEARKASQNLTLNKQISNKITELTQWREINSKAMTIPANKAEWQRYFDVLKNGEISSTEALKKFNKEWSDFNRRVKEAGQSGKTTTSILTAMYKKFGGWTLVTRSITQAIRLMKDMVVQVKEVDTSMVNLRKVTDASEQSLEKYRKTAAKASINLGTSLTDQIDATSIFSRLGYELDEAEKLGEIASTYKSVAEDLDIDTASQSIISTLKAYQNLGVTADEIVDKFNYVGKMLPLITISVKGQRCLRPR